MKVNIFNLFSNLFHQTSIAHTLVVVTSVVSVGAVGAAGVYIVKIHNDQQHVHVQQAVAKQPTPTTPTAPATVKGTPTTPSGSPKPSSPPTTPPSCSPNITMYVSSRSGLYLRSSASLDANPVALAPYGATVIAGCLANGWYLVTYDGKSGYMSESYLSSSKPSTTTPTPPTSTTPPSSPTPTTITIGSVTYECSPGPNDAHWEGLVYADKSPTYSYSSPNGSGRSSYAQWTNITGLSCASASGWLMRNGEYFLGSDLIVT